jgi:hypothetical protein
VRRSTGNQDPAALRETATQAVKADLSGDESRKAEVETKAADALAKAQGILVDQARTQIQDDGKQDEETAAAAKQKAQAPPRSPAAPPRRVRSGRRSPSSSVPPRPFMTAVWVP